MKFKTLQNRMAYLSSQVKPVFTYGDQDRHREFANQVQKDRELAWEGFYACMLVLVLSALIPFLR